jgi:predicted membrane protein
MNPPRRTLEIATRAVSLASALLVFGGLSLAPFVLGRTVDGRMHGGLGLMALGASAACFHGFGLRPASGVWRAVASPAVSWSLLAAGAGLLAL